MSPNAGGDAGSQPISTAVHRSSNKLRRSNFIFNLISFTIPSQIASGWYRPEPAYHVSSISRPHKTYEVYDRCSEMLFKVGLMRTVVKPNQVNYRRHEAQKYVKKFCPKYQIWTTKFSDLS